MIQLLADTGYMFLNRSCSYIYVCTGGGLGLLVAVIRLLVRYLGGSHTIDRSGHRSVTSVSGSGPNSPLPGDWETYTGGITTVRTTFYCSACRLNQGALWVKCWRMKPFSIVFFIICVIIFLYNAR